MKPVTEEGSELKLEMLKKKKNWRVIRKTLVKIDITNCLPTIFDSCEERRRLWFDTDDGCEMRNVPTEFPQGLLFPDIILVHAIFWYRSKPW